MNPNFIFLFLAATIPGFITMASTTAATSGHVRGGRHRNLINDCVIELAMDNTTIQTIVDQSCTNKPNMGVGQCTITIPNDVIREYRTQCQRAGGRYIGILNARSGCYGTLCNATTTCSSLDVSTCRPNFDCLWTDSGCKTNPSTNCWPFVDYFTYVERPKCIRPTCDCVGTASDVVLESTDEIQSSVAKIFAEFDGPYLTCSSDLDSSSTCSDPAPATQSKQAAAPSETGSPPSNPSSDRANTGAAFGMAIVTALLADAVLALTLLLGV